MVRVCRCILKRISSDVNNSTMVGHAALVHPGIIQLYCNVATMQVACPGIEGCAANSEEKCAFIQ